MIVVPMTLSQVNDLISRWHRHHKPVQGHRFSIGARLPDGSICGAAVVGRPVSREVDQYSVAEVTRLVTNGYPNACSFLYGACARIAKEMGFTSIQTYILETESGVSLKAAGWKRVRNTSGGSWNSSVRTGLRCTDQPETPKQCWALKFRDPINITLAQLMMAS